MSYSQSLQIQFENYLPSTPFLPYFLTTLDNNPDTQIFLERNYLVQEDKGKKQYVPNVFFISAVLKILLSFSLGFDLPTKNQICWGSFFSLQKPIK